MIEQKPQFGQKIAFNEENSDVMQHGYYIGYQGDSWVVAYAENEQALVNPKRAFWQPRNIQAGEKIEIVTIYAFVNHYEGSFIEIDVGNMMVERLIWKDKDRTKSLFIKDGVFWRIAGGNDE